MKITVCAKCGSQDLETLAWVDLRTKQYRDYHETINGPEYFCNKCGDSRDVKEVVYSEKHGCAYAIWDSNDPVLMWWPAFVDGSIQIEDDGEVDLGHCMAEEGRAFYEEILALFPDKKNEVTYIFRNHVDTVKDYVKEKVEVCIDIAFREAHEHFKTKSGDEYVDQIDKCNKIKADLVELITAQVKQNL